MDDSSSARNYPLPFSATVFSGVLGLFLCQSSHSICMTVGFYETVCVSFPKQILCHILHRVKILVGFRAQQYLRFSVLHNTFANLDSFFTSSFLSISHSSCKATTLSKKLLSSGSNSMSVFFLSITSYN